jgi:hypothetical protein
MYSLPKELSARTAALGVIVVLAGLAMLSGAARAANWTLFSCAYPNGTPVDATSGWSTEAVGSPGPYSGTGNTCGTIGGSFGAESSNEWPQNLYSGWQWVFATPTGSKIVGGNMQVGFYTPKGQAYVEDPENGYGPDVIANCQYNLTCTTTQYPTLPDNSASHIYVGAECAQAPCEPAGVGVDASAAVYRATIVMQNTSVPTGGSFEGGLSTATALSGEQELTLTTADPNGPGVYNVTATIDGTTVYNQTPAGDTGTCVNQGQVTEGYSFLSVTPCSPSLSVTIPVDTGTLTDGTHTMKVTVTDAASNSAIVFDKTISTNNAPEVATPPSISGTAQVGSTLSGTNAVFIVRSGLGPLGAVKGQWLRCSEASQHCSEIEGATGITYTPVGSDKGYTIEYENSVEDAHKHKASATSAPTVAVSEAPGSGGSCTSPGCSSSGGANGGTGGTGGNGADAGSSGTGGSGASTGAPVTVDVLPGGSNLGSVLLGSAARWSVSLRVSPVSVRRHSKIKLTGLVSTSPRPGEGKLIYLQARSVGSAWKGKGRARHRVVVYGKWVTFQAFRAKSDGSFASTYTFKLGGKHTYQFQAVAPAEGQYRNPTGTSRTITVKEI